MINFTVILSATGSLGGGVFGLSMCLPRAGCGWGVAGVWLGVWLGLSRSVSRPDFPPASSPPRVTARVGVGPEGKDVHSTCPGLVSFYKGSLQRRGTLTPAHCVAASVWLLEVNPC